MRRAWRPAVRQESKPDVHRQAVAVTRARGAEASGLALGDQQRGAADGDGVEDVVALGAGKALDRAGEAVLGQQAASLGIAVRLALLAEHRLAAVHAREGQLGMRLVDKALELRPRAQQLVDLAHFRKQVE